LDLINLSKTQILETKKNLNLTPSALGAEKIKSPIHSIKGVIAASQNFP
jgi:hypothetical protein